jgi:DNA-binding transcriptional ArsR family regulator
VDGDDDPAGVALRALVEPRRRSILRLVSHDELSAGEIASAFDVTRPAVSQHLTVLKDAGLLTERREGTRRLYRARPEGLEPLVDWMGHYGTFWRERFANLRTVLKEIDP